MCLVGRWGGALRDVAYIGKGGLCGGLVTFQNKAFVHADPMFHRVCLGCGKEISKIRDEQGIAIHS